MSVLRKIVNPDWNRGAEVDYATRVIVTNVPAIVTAEKLKPLFSKFGEIVNFKLVGRDPRSHIKQERVGQIRTNLLFIQYQTRDSASKAVEGMHNYELETVKLRVSIQLSPQQRKALQEKREQREQEHQAYLERKARREQREQEYKAYLERKAKREQREKENHEAYLERKAKREQQQNESQRKREQREQDVRPRKPLPVDWFCPKCKTLNFSHREKCLRKTCDGVPPTLISK